MEVGTGSTIKKTIVGILIQKSAKAKGASLQHTLRIYAKNVVSIIKVQRSCSASGEVHSAALTRGLSHEKSAKYLQTILNRIKRKHQI